MCKKSQRGAYIFVFYINSPVLCEVRIHKKKKKIDCVAFTLVPWLRIISFVMKLILYTFKKGNMSIFFRIEYNIST